MLCKNCGKDWSDKVYPIHVKICKPVEQEQEGEATMNAPETNLENHDEESLRALAKENDVKSWHNKKLDSIISELKEKGVLID